MILFIFLSILFYRILALTVIMILYIFLVYFILQNSSINWKHDSFHLFCVFYFTEFYL